MTSAWRVITFFTVVFVLPTLLISIPLYARYHIYHARTLSYTDGDMVSFHQDVSSFWCQGQRVVSNGTFEAYLTKEAKRKKRRSRSTKLSSEILLTHDDIEEWGIHLIQGSMFTFSACSRWPGGTLLVVQGEDNFRRCFYKEERLKQDLEGDNTQNKKKLPEQVSNVLFKVENEDVNSGVKDGWVDRIISGDDRTNNGGEDRPISDRDDRLTSDAENRPNTYGEGREDSGEEIDEDKGGEIFDTNDDEVLIPEHQIRQLHSSNRNKNKPNKIQSTTDAIMSKQDDDQEMTVKSNLNNSEENKDEIIKNKKRKLSDKKRRRKEKRILERKEKENSDLNQNSSRIVKRDIKFTDTSKMESIKVDKGSFFFNHNDTLDITTGNSSFSSSEEFLRQCSDTIISIDLSPYPDCKQRSSKDKKIQWKFRANDTDNYYFIFTSDNSLEANVISFRILLERRLYDVSDNLDSCSNSSECVFPFSFMKSEGVIVDFNERHVNDSKLENLNNYAITTICQPRSVVYTVFILLVPFIIILFAFR